MAIVKIPTERERERRHDEDVCNLFLTRVEFHHGPTATTIFVPPHGNNYFSATQPPRIRIRRWIPVQFLEIVVVGLRSAIVRSSPCVSTGEFWPVAERGEEGREM